MAAAFMSLQTRRSLRRQRVFRDRNNPLDFMDDEEIMWRYRLTREFIQELCELLQDMIRHPTRRSQSTSQQVLCVLRFYSSGSFQAVAGDLYGVSQSTMSRVIKSTTAAILHLADRFIFMPRDEASLRSIMSGFHELADFPNVVVAIDCTNVRIQAPHVDEHAYVNRRRYHSINVQGFCDSSLRFTNKVAQWPGSTHDSFIYTNSGLCRLFESGAIPIGWLVGDSGYPLRTELMTPIVDGVTQGERRFTRAHIKTRNPIERAFGVLKMRFRCQDTSGGALLYSPEKVYKIVIAAVVLHNMCIASGLPLPDDNYPMDNDLGTAYEGGDENTSGVL